MAALLTCTQTPLVMDTVPAVKIVNFNGSPKKDMVYAYARLYVLNGALCFRLTRFEEAPSENVRMGIAICSANQTDKFLYLWVDFNANAQLCIYNNGAILQSYTSPKISVSHGGDEQGLYFTAEGTINGDIIETALGQKMKPNAVFAGNIYSYDVTESSFGAAFKVPIGQAIPTQSGFEAFTCVSY